jgi:citrate lyase subunit alpha/citrate CoA-transferase
MSSNNYVMNAVGRKVPQEIDGKTYHPYAGAFASPPDEDKRRVGHRPGSILHPGENLLVPSIREAIERIELRDGMTVSFHHHFREGDKVLNLVMEEIASLGIKDLTLAPSSLYSVHEPLIDHIRNGVVTCIEGGSARGKVGKALSSGLMDRPITLRSHGGRVRAIERGDLHIDAAFIGSPCADAIGNCNGVKGPSACGPLAYSLADAIYSEKTGAITDYMEETPCITYAGHLSKLL